MPATKSKFGSMRDQEQFLQVLDRDEADRRFRAAINLTPCDIETVPLDAALGRVLSAHVVSLVDVPFFDRSNVDGYAVVAQDTFGASEEAPRSLLVAEEEIHTGVVPTAVVESGKAVLIATGGMVPRGADAVVMVEDTDMRAGELYVTRAVTPGTGISFAGTDITAGETVLRRGRVLTSRDTGVLAAIGVDHVNVWRKPIVAILSTGDEIIAPGNPMQPAKVYDSNAQVLADAVRELGGEPRRLGIVPDDLAALRERLHHALEFADIVLMSGGTSKGAGDVSYRVVSELGDPGIVAHGVALKPGKPICLAATGGRAVVVLPGFPTSAIFTFHAFVAPLIRARAGLSQEAAKTVTARLPVRIASELGREEFVLVSLVAGSDGPIAFPTGKGSGAVTAFSQADGFLAIDALASALDADSSAEVTLIGESERAPDLVIMGSHDVALDVVVGALAERGFSARTIAVGSLGGVNAATRGECDVAPVHLVDPATGIYNKHLLSPGLSLVPGWRRMQGFVFRPGDARFAGGTADAALKTALAEPAILMVNRNAGSGTRVLVDGLLRGARPAGYANQPRSHNAVAAAIAQNRADWGVAIEPVARMYGLAFLPIAPEHYDFLLVEARSERPAVQAFVAALRDEATRARIRALGMEPA